MLIDNKSATISIQTWVFHPYAMNICEWSLFPNIVDIFCTWIYTCKTLNFLKFTVPPSSTDIQLIYNVSVRQDVQWKKGYWLVLKFHKETYIIVSCTVDVIFTHVIGMKRSPYIFFLKTWAKFNADIFVRVQRWAIYWFLKCKALEI